MDHTYNYQNTPLTKLHTSIKKKSSSDYNKFIKNYKKKPNNNLSIKNIIKKLSRKKFKTDEKKKHKSRRIHSHKFNKPIIVKKLQPDNRDTIHSKPDELKLKLKQKSVITPEYTPPTHKKNIPIQSTLKKNKLKKNYNKKQLMNIKNKIKAIKKHSLSRRKKYTKRSKNRHVIVNLKSPTTNKKNTAVKKLIEKLSSKDLRKILINKNVINKNSKTPDKLLKDIYMYSELCNVNITK